MGRGIDEGFAAAMPVGGRGPRGLDPPKTRTAGWRPPRIGGRPHKAFPKVSIPHSRYFEPVEMLKNRKPRLRFLSSFVFVRSTIRTRMRLHYQTKHRRTRSFWQADPGIIAVR